MAELARLDPLDGLPPALAAEPGLTVTQRRGLTLLQLMALPQRIAETAGALRLPTTPGRSAPIPGGVALPLAPGSWMLLGDGGRLPREDIAWRIQGLAYLSDESHGRVVLRLAGARLREVMAKGCRLDLDRRAFGAGSCARTQIAEIGVLLHQADAAPSYDLIVAAGYARAFLHWIEASAAEFGYRFDISAASPE
jgi:heterotetrameric sarcosine oxidase gamma subunit